MKFKRGACNFEQYLQVVLVTMIQGIHSRPIGPVNGAAFFHSEKSDPQAIYDSSIDTIAMALTRLEARSILDARIQTKPVFAMLAVSQFVQICQLESAYLIGMKDSVKILTVKRDDGDGIFVTFSDGTCAGYVAEEMLNLRPHREASSEQVVPISEE